jgi:AcrR family transcriptional regulator
MAVKSSARAELASLTKDRIMAAVAALLRRSHEDVTFELVATESGVPQRTLYRHFANKDALFAAFWTWLNRALEMPDNPRTPDELVAHIPALFAAFDRDAPLVRAMLHNPHGRSTRQAHAEARRAKFRTALAEITDGLDAPIGGRLLVAVTAICSASGWETMKDNWELDGPPVAAAAQWAVKALIDEARGNREKGRV